MKNRENYNKFLCLKNRRSAVVPPKEKQREQQNRELKIPLFSVPDSGRGNSRGTAGEQREQQRGNRNG